MGCSGRRHAAADLLGYLLAIAVSENFQCQFMTLFSARMQQAVGHTRSGASQKQWCMGYVIASVFSTVAINCTAFGEVYGKSSPEWVSPCPAVT